MTIRTTLFLLLCGVALPLPAQQPAPEALVKALISRDRSFSDLVPAKCSWTPIRGGISADGTQGFTFDASAR
jgi:hypothetical protein